MILIITSHHSPLFERSGFFYAFKSVGSKSDDYSKMVFKTIR